MDTETLKNYDSKDVRSKLQRPGVPIVVQWLTNPTRNHEVAGSVPALAQWVNGSSVAVSCGVGCRLGSDPELL